MAYRSIAGPPQCTILLH